MARLPLLLLMVAGVFSAPYFQEFDEKIIAQEPECDEALTRFRSTATSVYDYFGETENAVVGASPDSTGMKISGTVYVKPVKRCVFSMQISQTELFLKSKTSSGFTKAAESKKFSKELEAQELLFRVRGGEIVAILPTTREKTHILNIKRGILSTLQLGNTATQRVETDVNGNCAVEFQQVEDKIVKTKNLTKCSERARTELGIQSASIEQSDLPLSPLDSKSTCSFKVDGNGKIVATECRETHLFRPFSAGYQAQSGAMTTVYQSLVLLDSLDEGKYVQNTANQFSELQEVSLLYSYEHEEVKPVNTLVDRIDSIMNSLVDQSDKRNLAVKQNYAHEFSQLVTLLRKLDRKRMTPVWDKYFDCAKSRICQPNEEDLREVYKQYLLDALTYCGTPTCVYMVHNVIVDELVTGERMNMFLQGIALVAKPTKAMIRDIMNIATKVPSRQAYLTLGTLMYRYCNANPEGCAYEKTNPVTQAELFLEEKLGESCEGQEDVDKVEELIRTFKAIGNSGRPNHAWATLIRCARSSLHQNVSIAALEAMRRMPCSEERLLQLHEMLSDINTDPERRIHAFLALMKCPKKESLRRIVHRLEVEPSKQVSSFVWSHLKNVIDSSDPVHEECQKHLKEILQGRTLRVPELDITKYSRAFEGSMHSKWLKSGLTTEGHVIFHPESYLPRSGLLNFTANVMGIPLNVLEMAVRVEGLETIIEDFFGPNGVMPDNSILKLFNITITKEDFERAERNRNRRSLDDTIESNIDDLHARVNKRRIHPSGHLSVKMFGHNMRLFSYDDIFWMIDQIDNMNVIQLLLNLAKGGHKTFTKSFMFLEMTQTVPTGLGLPLKLKLTGSAVASLELDGKFDIRNMFWGPSQMEMKGFLRPSAVAEISGKMGIESHFINSGMLVRSSVFTSQTLKGGIVFKEGQILKVNVDVPEEPVTLFNVTSAPYLYVNDEIEMIKGAPRRISPDFCLKDTYVTGLGVCTSFGVPVAFREYESPYFPLSGPAHYGMKLIKADKKLTTYQILVQKERVEQTSYDKKETIGTFEIGTPGATYSRRIGGIVRYVETPKSRSLTVGTLQGEKKVEVYFTHHTDTNRFEAEFVTNVATTETISTRFVFFNDTTKLNRHMGILLSAKYGTYKVEQTLKMVNSKSSYKFHSRTTYLPRKHLTGEIEFTPADKSINVRFDANQFKQTVDLRGQLVNTATKKGLQFNVYHLGSQVQADAFIGYTADEVLRQLVIKGSMNGRDASASIGVLKTGEGYELQMTGEALGERIVAFSKYSKVAENEGARHEVSFGARYADKSAGGRVYYQSLRKGVNTNLCGTVFFNSEEPASLCLALDDNPSDEIGFYKRASVTGRILKQKLSMNFEFEKESDFYAFNTTLLYNARVLAQNSWLLTYEGIWNTELKMITKVRGREAVFSVYSSSKENDVVFGIQGAMMGQSVALTATYSTEYREDTAIYGVMFEAFVNKKLPVDYHLVVEWGQKTKGISSTLTVMQYKVRSSTMMTKPSDQDYSLVSRMAVKKGDFVIFGLKDAGLLRWSDNTKSYKQQYQVTVWGKDFSFGWKLRYSQGLDANKQTIHELMYSIRYGQGKSITFTTSLLNGNDVFEVFLTCQFLKNRKVVHSLVYDKLQRRLSIDIEFLPKMFVKFFAKLDKEQGWKLTTNVKFDWERMNKVLEWVAKYTDTNDLKGLAFQWNIFGRRVSVRSLFETAAKRASFAVDVLGRTVKVSGSYDHTTGTGHVQLLTIANDVTRVWIEALASVRDEEYGLEIRTPTRSLMRTIVYFRKESGEVSLSLLVLNKQIIGIDAKYDKAERTMIFNLSSMDKQRLSITAKFNPDERTVFLHFDALKRNLNIGLAAKYNPAEMSVTFSVEIMKKIMGLMLRADYRNYVVATNLFYQDRVVGWKAYMDPVNKALVYNVTLSPTLSVQSVLQVVEDHIVKFTLQRKIGGPVANEATFKFDLKESESNLIFQWNKDTLALIRNYLTPIFKRGYDNVTTLAVDAMNAAKAIAEVTRQMSMEAVKNATSAFLRGTDRIDERFDDFDFVAARDNAGELLIKAGRQTTKLVQKIILLVRDYSLILHDNIPMYLENVLASKEKIAKVTGTLIRVARNVTESAKPLILTAVDLAKDFRLRDRTIKEIVDVLIQYVKRVSSDALARAKFMVKENIPLMIKTIKETRIPYREENIGEAIKMLDENLRKFTYDYDVVQTAEWLKTEILKMKIVEKSVEEYFKLLEQEARKLPAVAKEIILQTVKVSKESIEDIKQVVEKVQEHMAPLVTLLNKVKVSAIKHYTPLVKKLAMMAKAKGEDFYGNLFKPLKTVVNDYVAAVLAFTGPLEKPLKTAFDDIVNQVRVVRIMEKDIGSALDEVLERISTEARSRADIATQSIRENVRMVKARYQLVSQMTPEEMIDEVFAQIATSIERITEFTRKLWSKRIAIYRKNLELIKFTVVGVYNYLDRIRSYSLDDLNAGVEQTLTATADRLAQICNEVANVAVQLANLDFNTPLERAWKESDLLGHLDRYGVNKKVATLITKAKNGNLTDLIVTTVQRIIREMNTLYTETATALLEYKQSVSQVISYLQSIPKKDFVSFYDEVETLVSQNQEKLVSLLRKRYQQAYEKMGKLYYNLLDNYYNYYKDYAIPAMGWYGDIQEKTRFIYEDNREDAIKVYQEYKKNIMARLENDFAKAKEMILRRYRGMYNKIFATLRKYESMTIEQIGQLAYTEGERLYGNINVKAIELLEKLKRLSELAVRVYGKMYRDVKTEVERYYHDFEANFRPRIMDIYKRMYNRMQTMASQGYERATQVYQKAYSQVDEWYAENKASTIEQLYLQGEARVSEVYQKYYNSLTKELKVLYKKADQLLTEVVVPELKKEMESVFNQTLRASVILGNKTVECFSPHYSIVKEKVIEGLAYGKEYGAQVYANSKVTMTMRIKKLVKYILELIKTVRQHPLYTKYEKLVSEHQYVKAAMVQYKKTLLQLDEQYQELIRTIKDLLQHEMVINAKDKVRTYAAQLDVKKAMEMMKGINESAMYTIEQLRPKISAWMKDARETLESLPDSVTAQASYFRQNPEDCVWSNYRKLVNIVKNIKNVDLKDVYENKRNDLIGLMIEATDLKTKELAMDSIQKLMDLYKKIRTLPAEVQSKYAYFLAEYEKRLNATISLVKTSWEESPVRPIIEHDVWTELVDDVKTHELVEGFYGLVRTAVEDLMVYGKKLKETMMLKKEELKLKVQAEYEKAVKTVKKFVKETTVEDIVTYTRDSLESVKSAALQRKAQLERIIGQQYSALEATFENYKKVTMEEMKKYVEQVKTLVKQWKPKALEAMKRMSETAVMYREKLMTIMNENKIKMTEKAVEMWNKSGIQEKFNAIIKMTIREVIDEMLALPAKARSQAEEYKSQAIAKYSEVSTRVRRFAEPYVSGAEKIARWVGNEVNETAVFVYRYYGLDTKAVELKDALIAKGKEILPKIPGFIRSTLKDTSKLALKAVHSSFVYIDGIDLAKTKEYVQKYVPDVKGFVNKYVVVDPEEMKIMVIIPHYMPVTPSFSYQIEKINGTVRLVANKSIESAKKLIEAMKQRTEELRRDLTDSYSVNKRIAAAGFKTINQYKEDIAAMAEKAGKMIVNETNARSKEMYTKVQRLGNNAYEIVKDAVKDVYESESMPQAYQKVKVYGNEAMEYTRQMLMTRMMIIRVNAEEMYKAMVAKYEKALVDLKPYYSLIKAAVEDVKNGKDFKAAFQHVNAQARKTYRYIAAASYKRYLTILKYLEVEDAELSALVREYKAIHRQIFGKYQRRINRLYRMAKVILDRGIRVAKSTVGKRAEKPAVEPLKSTAMIFGKTHVMSFDGKVYEIPPYNKDTCTYLLARDFHNGNFTVYSQKERIVIVTPEMKVWISRNGDVTSVLKTIKKGIPFSKQLRGLPVQSPTGKCVREGAFVKCDFNVGLEVSCAVEHYACTIQLSGWHYAKTEGLLGSNNNERFDDFKKPSGIIAETTKEFVNSWEITKSPECVASSNENVAPCNRAPSSYCKVIFSGESSPLKSFFSIVDPLPFLKACEIESAACDSLQSTEISHCNTTAAYINVIKAMGYSVRYLPQCAKHQTHNLYQTWTVSPKKELDMVILISERSTVQSRSKTVASLLFNLHRNHLTGYNTRYALIGFGGSLVNEEPHVRTLEGRVFMNEYDATTAIKEIPYGGQVNMSNDAYGAIRLASTLKFRPEAIRVFLLINADNQVSHIYGPTLDETEYALLNEADASLFVFDQINFKNIGVKGRIFGQTLRKVYVAPEYRAVSSNVELPSGPFKVLAQKSNGGLFSNKFKPSQEKVLVTALADALSDNLRSKSQACKTCSLYLGNAGEGIPLCKGDSRMTC